METAIRIRTSVLPGHRVEIVSPQLPEGTAVEVIVLLPDPAERTSLYEWLAAGSPASKPRSADSWEQYDQLIQEERSQWD